MRKKREMPSPSARHRLPLRLAEYKNKVSKKKKNK